MVDFSGRCHCGAVKFDVEISDFASWECNCSLCIRTGAIYHRVPEAAFRLNCDDSVLQSYGERNFVNHKFCKTCNIMCFSEVRFGTDELMICVNLRCCPEVDLQTLDVEQFNGATSF